MKLTPGINGDPITLPIEDILRVAQALDMAFLGIRDTAPGDRISCRKLDTVKPDCRISLEEMDRWISAAGVIPSSAVTIQKSTS
jgi:hypothetical protein